jgi:HD-GYP domain-containing protein (c-di-GMP phosphodiesterase class II)
MFIENILNIFGLISLLVILIFLRFKKYDITFKKYEANHISEIDMLNSKIQNQDIKINRLSEQKFHLKEHLLKTLQKLNLTNNEKQIIDNELINLLDVSKIMSSTLDIDKIIEILFRIINDQNDCERLFIAKINEKNELFVKYQYSVLENFTKYDKCSIDEDSIIYQCYDENKPIIRNNQYLLGFEKNVDEMAVPIIIHDKNVGIMCIQTTKVNTYTDKNLNYFIIIANQSGMAIENAELFRNVTEQKEEIEALYEETSAINQELSDYIVKLDTSQKELEQKNSELQRLYSEAEKNYFETVKALANSIEAMDPYTRGHCERVMDMSLGLAKKLKFSPHQMSVIQYAAILHDIGKLGIPSTILKKPSSLDEHEYEEVKKHPLIAYQILKDIGFMKRELAAILQHHERHDGKGYPYGISGDDITIEGKILCIADAFDAMTTDRPYRKGLTIQDALKEIDRCKGTQFDPLIAEKFIEYISEQFNENNNKVGGECA